MVRPVELQDALAKTPAIERISQLQKASPENEQRQAMAAGQQKAHEAQKRPEPPPSGDEVVLHHDEDKERPDRKRQNRGNRDEQNEAPIETQASDADGPPEDTPGPPNLDITV